MLPKIFPGNLGSIFLIFLLVPKVLHANGLVARAPSEGTLYFQGLSYGAHLVLCSDFTSQS